MHSDKRSNNVAMYVINKVPAIIGHLVVSVSWLFLQLRQLLLLPRYLHH